ncbi:MAG: Asp-tRNA(Asn)/Glu-tRNA(Gln) amidotransferase subunit GatB [Spirochaetota bacterium]|jgi:aspartyl-tRNA(Asn)/glutamyl-tRNA(Gln) amidotransferase subunit B|nr:Asp-tRNA(Asn)/Glu-tRNA(Gln) amidotransferase subunit GatB [Spirochaetota bacterium]
MYQTFIGLEVHIHLRTQTKVFCGCRSAFGDTPNTNICPVCMGYPGVLPSLNIEAMRMGMMVARALSCHIPEKTWFERKQYFYPDMTKNYQISQFASPLGQQGYVDIEGKIGSAIISKRVRIRECHLEEDAGKMIHAGAVSRLDYNRAGVSLLEVVTEPDMETGEEAELFIQQFRRMVRYLGVCDGNMEEGSLRADANVSINLPGEGLGKKVEIKNLNSSRFVRLGLAYEISRQGDLMDAGKPIIQETRLWNEARNETLPMRRKENAQDYRYFPEPDLPIFAPDAAFLQSVDSAMVELPLPRIRRIISAYGLGEEQAGLICEEKSLADYFETAVSQAEAAGLAKNDAGIKIANWLLQDVKRILGKEGMDISDIGAFRLHPARMASLAVMTAAGKISGKTAKQVLDAVAAEDKDPAVIVEERGWQLLSDPAQIACAARTVMQTEAAAVTEIQASATTDKRRSALTAYLVGKVLAATGGKADPKIVNSQLEELLREAAK